MSQQTPNLKSLASYFLVEDIVQSAEYYRDVLGFGFEGY
jgi:hypothetical protein